MNERIAKEKLGGSNAVERLKFVPDVYVTIKTNLQQSVKTSPLRGYRRGYNSQRGTDITNKNAITLCES